MGAPFVMATISALKTSHAWMTTHNSGTLADRVSLVQILTKKLLS